MLVIRRRPGESFWIGDSIEIEVVEAGPGKVKLGISAPREVPVLRSEVKTTRDQNRIAASGLTAAAVESLLAGIQPCAPALAPPRKENPRTPAREPDMEG